jgi:hypothetical protein
LLIKILIRIKIQIRLDPHWFGILVLDPYPDPHRDVKKAVSGTALKLERIHNTGSQFTNSDFEDML